MTARRVRFLIWTLLIWFSYSLLLLNWVSIRCMPLCLLYTGGTVPISQIYPVYWNNPLIKSWGWTSQAQLELGLDFTSIDLHQIGKQDILFASLTAINNFQPESKITQYRPLTPSVPPSPVTQATTGHSKATPAPIHYPTELANWNWTCHSYIPNSRSQTF